MDDGFWVFGYGSLMWQPGFEVAEQVIAEAEGWRRSFCLRSICHRGTPDRPGLVLGLESAPGHSCFGLAMRVDAAHWPATLGAIRARELVTEAYREESVPLALADGRRVAALTYVMRDGHPQHARGLSLDRQAEIIVAAAGGRGPNADYLFNTARHLADLGIPDTEIAALADRVRTLGQIGSQVAYSSGNRPR